VVWMNRGDAEEAPDRTYGEEFGDERAGYRER
jgi:hypothetical protein